MNVKRLFAATAVAGMLAVTGCSYNTPERNDGNRNGERLTEAVHRNNGRTSRGLFGRTTRGIRTPNRANNLGRNTGRVDRTFRYGGTREEARMLNQNNYGMNRIDRGVTQNGANRSTRRAQSNRVRNVQNGIGLANVSGEAVAVASIDGENFVFFNKKGNGQAPEPSAPETTPAPAPSAYNTYYDYDTDYYYENIADDYNLEPAYEAETDMTRLMK